MFSEINRLGKGYKVWRTLQLFSRKVPFCPFSTKLFALKVRNRTNSKASMRTHGATVRNLSKAEEAELEIRTNRSRNYPIVFEVRLLMHLRSASDHEPSDLSQWLAWSLQSCPPPQRAPNSRAEFTPKRAVTGMKPFHKHTAHPPAYKTYISLLK